MVSPEVPRNRVLYETHVATVFDAVAYFQAVLDQVPDMATESEKEDARTLVKAADKLLEGTLPTRLSEGADTWRETIAKERAYADEVGE